MVNLSLFIAQVACAFLHMQSSIQLANKINNKTKQNKLSDINIHVIKNTFMNCL